MESEEPRTIDIRNFRPGKPPTKVILWGALLLIAAMVVISSVFTIQPEEVGIVLRFGEFNRTTDPGLNFKLPAPMEQVLKVPVQRQLKQEFGFQTVEAGVRTRYSDRDFEGESLMLTGDLNVAVVEWIAQYRVADPYKYLFKVRSVSKTFRDMNEAVMRSVVGDRSVDEVITVGRLQIEDEVKLKLQELCDRYETGIVVDQIVLQNVNPPDPVKPSFNEVNQAEQERERSINEARGDYNRVIPRARGEAAGVVEQAKGYAIDRVNRARGDAVLFGDVYAAYRRAPEVTRRRIFLETMEAIYPAMERKILLDNGLQGVLPLLQLGGAEVKQ
ncbi:MAG: FtsH protease activity modulator HflK [Acidobacteria bacterium]|nr:FtsH protease activity modulator HflK [Candidatus Sulfomarinibacter kjeldsenii]